MSKIWLVMYYGRGEDGDSVDPDPELESAREAYASEGGALRGIATVLRTWCSDGEYVGHKSTRERLSTLLQREHYRAALKLWNEYSERLHDPAGVYGISLKEVPFDASEHPAVVEDVEKPEPIVSKHDHCLGFRIGKYGELWPCGTCGLSDEEVHDRLQALIKQHPPAKKDHPDNDGCGATCRGWDVFQISGSECILSEFAVTRSDACGVFEDDDQAVSSACVFLHRVTGVPYGDLLTDKPGSWCSKCSAPIFPESSSFLGVCIECSTDRVMPWCEEDEEWMCDCCGKQHNFSAAEMPSLDYDNSLAESLGVMLCEPCCKQLREMTFVAAVRKIAAALKTRGDVTAATRICYEFNVPLPRVCKHGVPEQRANGILAMGANIDCPKCCND